MNLEIYRPLLRRKDLSEVTAEDIRSLGGKAVAIDADNTSCFDGTSDLLPVTEPWIQAMKDAEIPVILLTNASLPRAKKMAESYGAKYVATANKPRTRGFFKAAKKMGVAPSELVMIGDQLMTDIKGANKAGCPSIYVIPYEREHRLYIHFFIRRMKTRYVLHALERKH